ncbi:phosphotransferase [Gallibacterium trehalosifermentans]|uniref:Phosphotransferase n=1 Tax=Gallibacterium trehalosifermentans TaxID=516935 RepID=A0ABV6H122_9PAST
MNDVISYFCSLIDLEEHLIVDCNRIGGMTNTNYLLTTKSGKFVFRTAGKASNKIINRQYEYNNSLLMSKLGVNPEVIYFDKSNGDKITKYINNAKTLSPYNIFEYLETILDLLVRIHASDIKFENRWDYLKEYTMYKNLTLDSNVVIDEKYLGLESNILQLYEKLFLDLGVYLSPCHNDLVAENFVIGDDNLGEKKLYLIDWEYSGLNDPMWDLASLFEESSFPQNIEKEFLENYYDLWNIKVKNIFSNNADTPPPTYFHVIN